MAAQTWKAAICRPFPPQRVIVVPRSTYGCTGQISRRYTTICRASEISVLEGGTVSLLRGRAFGEGSRGCGENSSLRQTLVEQRPERHQVQSQASIITKEVAASFESIVGAWSSSVTL